MTLTRSSASECVCGCSCACKGSETGREYVYGGKVNRGRCDLEELGFEFRKHATWPSLVVPPCQRTPIVGLRSNLQSNFQGHPPEL